MAYYGNLALRPERVQEEKVQQKRAQSTATHQAKVARRRSIPIGEKLLYLFTIGLVVFIAGFIIFRYAQIYQINGQIQQTNKTYEQATEQTKELQREVERLSNPSLILEKAQALGYGPKKDKIVINSSKDENAVAKR
ncbi:cell division protein FtsL [Cohnella luojiensis]|uniref:Cell division initiation protein n=1 Tax=Cohnella luojiensis TaxID=652876 RepID=A0A4Y8M9G8_9BACL|nr:septum formation initiator family protein [Cohnella luojiensis]TFE31729.1 cell division initiation protein [Cohnella luojiensis]